MTTDVTHQALRVFKGQLARTREKLIPPAFQFLWEVARFIVAYGGRASGKSWSIARVLLVLADEKPLRVMVCREIMSSIKESAYRLLCDQIALLGLDDYVIRADSIGHKNGSEFIFEHLRYNDSRLRSLEGVDVCWIEEAQAVSDRSFETLLPTIRKTGSRFIISFNPMRPDDPVAERFVNNAPPDRAIARKVSWRDNPYLSPEVEFERTWVEQTDHDAYMHIWEGFPRVASDALILKDKFEVREFEISPEWSGPHHGLDYGFANDPCAGVRCYIDDASRTLYIAKEFWGLHVDIDRLPDVLEDAIPGIGRYTVFADSSRPESTSYLGRNGIPNARSAEKWGGSVDDGISYLRSFARIVIDPSCRHFLDECQSYSFKTDRLTGVPLPEPEDKNNHLIDSLRYALSPLIRNLPVGGYFSRAALLENGEPVEGGGARLMRITATAAVCDRAGSAVGVVYWGRAYGKPLVVLDYAIAEVQQACSGAWIAGVFARCQELRAELNPVEAVTELRVETGELFDAMSDAFAGYLVANNMLTSGRPPYDLVPIEALTLPVGNLDQRAAEVRMSVNSGSVKLSRHAYAQQTTHRDSATNHLTSQLFGFRPGADAAQELVGAFVLGMLMARGGALIQQEPATLPAVLVAPKSVTVADHHAAHIAKYQAELAAWKAKEAEAIAGIRARLHDPLWQPSGWFQLGIGRPPASPGQPV